MSTPKRFFLGSDNSSHWYVVPADKRKEWEAWTNLDEEDTASWNAPEFAERIGGSPHQIEFSDPKEAS